MESLSPKQARDLLYDWDYNARPNQIAPEGNWLYWLILAGRGYGKTRTGAEWIRKHAESGKVKRISLIAPTAADARDTMVEGESGILSVSHPDKIPHYEPSKRRITWDNGTIATLFSAEEPERLRGPQHEKIWADELAAWQNADETWKMAMFGLRLGNPQVCITTTPKPLKLLRTLSKDKKTVLTRGSSFENVSNLSSVYYENVIQPYVGTRLGRQEIEAEILDEAQGALWKRSEIEDLRVDRYPTFTRMVVAIDPAGTKSDTSDEVGMMIGGIDANGIGYLIEDISKKMTPNETSRNAVNAYHLYSLDRIVAEANNGGDWIEAGIRSVDATVSYKKLHASRGKQARAEPVAALCEQKKIKLVGTFPALEDELCSWEPVSGSASPNRLDAFVWLFTELMLHRGTVRKLHVAA